MYTTMQTLYLWAHALGRFPRVMSEVTPLKAIVILERVSYMTQLAS